MQSHTKSVPLFVSSVKAHLTASDRDMKRGFSFSCQTSERQNEIWMRRFKAAWTDNASETSGTKDWT